MIEDELFIRDWKALGHQVLVVVSVTKFPNGKGEWAAYIGAVAGRSYEEVWQEVLKYGTKLPKEVAKVIFPEYAKKYAWRD